MKLRVVASVLIAVIHFAFTVYAYGQADVAEHTMSSRRWATVLEVLAVPILYSFDLAERRIPIPHMAGMDWLPLVMLLNSLFWGAVIVSTFVWLRRRLGTPPAAA